MIKIHLYTGEGIAQIKKGDKVKYDTDRKPLPGDLVVGKQYGEMKVIRWHSNMRKKNDSFELRGVVTFI